MARQKLFLLESARKLIRGTPSLAEARDQVAATEAKIAEATRQLDEALQAEDHALLAVSDNVPGAAAVRDRARVEARRYKDELHDLRIILARQRQRLGDAEAAEKAAADAATWALANQIIARREQAAARADAALVDLSEALRQVESETGLLASLMGAAVQYIGLNDVRGNLRVLLGNSIHGKENGLITAKTVADVVLNQHEQVRMRVKL